MLNQFEEIWLVDFEFYQPSGERPSPLCMVAREFRSHRIIRLWQEDLRSMSAPPFSLGPETLYVAYFASAELGCHLALGWPMPAKTLDLYVEFRRSTSGIPTPCGAGLLGALASYGLDGLECVEKEAMRELAMRGGKYSPQEQLALLDYCQTDSDALMRLLPAMLPSLDIDRALLRGRYMGAVAVMEWNGIPIDTEALNEIRARWEFIQDRLIERVDSNYGVFDGRSFKTDRWEAWLFGRGIGWPRHESGALDLRDDTFREMSRVHPEVAPIRELRTSLSKLRLNELAVGSDGRNRCLLSPFASRTGRNQPSNSRFIFGPAKWLRGLIKPSEDMAIAYVDWEQQEFAIGGALSGDAAMQQAYRSGDPYLTFARQAGAVPANATKASHSAEREQFKVCALAVQYGMGAESLAKKLDDCPARGRELLELHRQIYRIYWRWSDSIRDCAVLNGQLQAAFGWTLHVTADANPRSLRNFPLQANGGEMLRIACCLAVERGIRVCAPIHDALLVEGPQDDIEQVVAETQRAMKEASEIVLSGFPLRTDAAIVWYPERYSDKGGETMWEIVCQLVRRGDAA